MSRESHGRISLVASVQVPHNVASAPPRGAMPRVRCAVRTERRIWQCVSTLGTATTLNPPPQCRADRDDEWGWGEAVRGEWVWVAWGGRGWFTRGLFAMLALEGDQKSTECKLCVIWAAIKTSTATTTVLWNKSTVSWTWFWTPSSLIQDEVLKYLGLEQAAGRYLEEMMTKLGSTASQRSLATPKHPIIIWTHLESSQYDEEANLWFIIMILLLALRDFSSKRWITTSQPIRCAKRFAANFCKIVLSVGFYRLLCNCNQYHNVNRWW